MIMLATALTVVAIVAADQTALQAAPGFRRAAGRSVAGDSLEIPRRKGDFLQVYDSPARTGRLHPHHPGFACNR